MEVMQGQNLLDVAVQTTGNADNALLIALRNGISLTDDLTAGQSIDTDAGTTDANTLNYYKQRNIHPATAMTAAEQAATPYGGIEFMGIEIDFIVK